MRYKLLTNFLNQYQGKMMLNNSSTLGKDEPTLPAFTSEDIKT